MVGEWETAPPTARGRWARTIVAFGLIAALLTTPFAFLLLGDAGVQSLRPLTAIPLSNDLVEPRSAQDKLVGVEYPIRNSRLWCGVKSPIDFNGSFWLPADHPPSSWIGEFTGSILMVDANRAVLSDGRGSVLTLRRSNALRMAACRAGQIELF